MSAAAPSADPIHEVESQVSAAALDATRQLKALQPSKIPSVNWLISHSLAAVPVPVAPIFHALSQPHAAIGRVEEAPGEGLHLSCAMDNTSTCGTNTF